METKNNNLIRQMMAEVINRNSIFFGRTGSLVPHESQGVALAVQFPDRLCPRYFLKSELKFFEREITEDKYTIVRLAGSERFRLAKTNNLSDAQDITRALALMDRGDVYATINESGEILLSHHYPKE